MIRSAHVTRKMYSRSAVHNLGSPHQQAQKFAARYSIIGLWQQKICVSNDSP